MEIINSLSARSPKNCQVGDAFKIEGVIKTVTKISKKYIYFDKGIHVPYKIFNYLVRQCKFLALNNNLDVVKRELGDKLERSETYNQAQELTINKYSKLSRDCIDEIDGLKESIKYKTQSIEYWKGQTKPSIISNPISLRFILIYHYGDMPYYEWLFAERHCFHSDMEKEYEEKVENSHKDYNIVGGGFYASFAEVDCDDDREYNINTIILFGESGTYGKVSKDHFVKATPLLEKEYDVRVL